MNWNLRTRPILRFSWSKSIRLKIPWICDCNLKELIEFYKELNYDNTQNMVSSCFKANAALLLNKPIKLADYCDQNVSNHLTIKRNVY